MKFSELLSTPGVESFLHDSWGRSFEYLKGSSGKFHGLLSWDDVNRMLQQHRLQPPRLRLVKRGEFAAKSTYLRFEGGTVPFVVPELLSERLRDGYTLIIDAVDDMVGGVMTLAEDIERVVHESVQVNLYAGWREEPGFNRHFDTHDVLVLQVYGKKQWRVYRGGRPHPLKNDSSAAGAAPDQVAWEGMLQDGDALYIPRGWWHEASGAGEATLHLTFGIHQRTGISFMQWITDELREHEAFRADLIRFGTNEEKRNQFEALRTKLIEIFDPQSLQRYLSDHDSRARSRGWASLPWSVADDPLPDGALIAIDTPRPFEVRPEDQSLIFRANRREWKVDVAAAPILDLLREGPATIDTLVANAPDLNDETVRAFVRELILQGLLRVQLEPPR